MVNNIIETFNLGKEFRLKGHKNRIVALKDVNISIKKGEKFGLLGPNGAGKTTLVSILTTLMQPTLGYAIIDGYNIHKYPTRVRRKIGLVLGNEMLYYRLTGYANLKFFCKIYQIPNYKNKIYEIAKELELGKWLNQYVSKYSSGMKVKLSLCRILLIDPEILFLDEPTFGVDIKMTNYIVNKLKSIDKTMFITSHNMNVVEKLCDRVAFIDRGLIKKIGTKEELGKLFQKGIKIEITINQNRNNLKSELEKQNFIFEIKEAEKGLIVFLKERSSYKDLFVILGKYSVIKFQEINMSIENLFLKII